MNPDLEIVKQVADKHRVLYAAQIICACQRRLGIVEARKVNNVQCDCGRQYQLSVPHRHGADCLPHCGGNAKR